MYDQRLYIDGEWLAGSTSRPVFDRWTGEGIGTSAIATAEDARRAVDSAERAMAEGLAIPRRAAILRATADAIASQEESFARAITSETGKPISAARAEVRRAVETLTWSAEEARRLPAEAVALDAVEAGAGTFSFTIAEPRGIAAAITPFNFPVNLVVHKLGPALAAGCAVVLKPSDKAVLVAGMLVDAFASQGLPAGWLNLVTGDAQEVVSEWQSDERVAVVTFTGSSEVGWSLRERSPRKHHVLELGSNTAMVIAADADLDRATDDAVTAAFSNSGQACVSLQRLYVVEDVASQVIDRLTERVRAVRSGDPRDDNTLVGPLITDAAADRIKENVDAAVAAGARLMAGGSAQGSVFEPTLLADVPADAALVCAEVFGPVLSVIVVDDLDHAIASVNDSDYGLNTAIYTSQLATAMDYARRAEAGSVLVNTPPSFRADHMPYGGVKDSGHGVEGVKYAVAELVRQKLIVLRP
jgi:acyl-CoA reductase-like NAD-dependent aldehyde dehydrogenase